MGLLQAEPPDLRLSFGALLPLLLLVVLLLLSCPPGASALDLEVIDPLTLYNDTTASVILDTRPIREWERGHIAGALNFPWERLTRTDGNGVAYSSLSPPELASVLAARGIDDKSPVVIYGDADTSWGSEGYGVWLFAWLGHKGPIRLLNGGIQGWRSRKLPLVKGAEQRVVAKTVYQVDLKPRYGVSTEEIQNRRGAFTLVDVRSTFEWLMGSIPGAVHIPWHDFYTGKDHHPLSAAELKKLLAQRGVDLSKPVVFYCTGGIRSAYAWMIYQLAALPDGRNYKGGWAAWEKRDKRRE